jgi:hypothetical protein
MAFQERQRAGPIAFLAARLQYRAAGPTERGRGGRGFLGVSACAFVIVAAVRFDEQAMQAERFGVGAARHGAEGALGAFAVAAKLGRLRAQEQRQRLARCETVGIGRKFSCGVDIAGANRDQTVGDRRVGARAAALTPPPGQHGRRTHNGANDAPDRHQHGHRDQQRRSHHQR